MPAIANITVKKADNVTDVIYTAITGSSGDGQPAYWRVEDTTLPAAYRPSLMMKTSSTSKGDARVVNIKTLRPETYTDSTTGQKVRVRQASVSITLILPTESPDSELRETAAQAGNLFDSAHIQECILTGFAPR
jgi:hypothetical protein